MTPREPGAVSFRQMMDASGDAGSPPSSTDSQARCANPMQSARHHLGTTRAWASDANSVSFNN